MARLGWGKLAGLGVIVVASMLVGALVLPDLRGGDEAPVDATPPPTSPIADVGAAQQPVTELEQPVVTEEISLADLVEDVVRSVVLIEPMNGGTPSGSGVVIDDRGHILTNFHVIENLPGVKVTFSDGSAAVGEVLGTDVSNDLAIVQVDPAVAPPAATLGDSDSVRPGDPVFAIGSPFSQHNTVTSGIVSAVGRVTQSPFTQRRIHDVIQIDAAVNPGNSGGPLFNYSGEVIGINTSIENPSGRFFVGIGFAVPSNTAQRLLPALLAGEVVEHPQLGVTVEPLDEVIAENLGLSVGRGIYVVDVEAGSAADRAGIIPAPGAVGRLAPGGDVIVALGGEPVRSFADLSRAIARHEVGDSVSILVNRDGQEIELTAQLQPWDVR